MRLMSANSRHKPSYRGDSFDGFRYLRLSDGAELQKIKLGLRGTTRMDYIFAVL